jgi:hypothetical protein
MKVPGREAKGGYELTARSVDQMATADKSREREFIVNSSFTMGALSWLPPQSI